MTFICGYIYKSTVSIIADSAETITSAEPWELPENTLPTSTFQETFIEDGDRKVIEAAQKIYVLRKKVILAFAGEVQTGLQGVEELNYLLLKNGSITEIIKEYFESCSLQNDFIVGFMDEKAARMYVYRGPTIQGLITGNTLVTAGLDFFHLALTVANLYTTAREKDIKPHDLLIYLLGNIQAITIHGLTIAIGIGGYLNGALITESGVEWAKDTTYILYSAKHDDQADKYIAARFNRENVTFITSTFFDRLFVNELDLPDARDIFDKWITSIVETSSKMRSEYYVAIAYDQYNIVILEASKEHGVTMLEDNGRFGFQFSDYALEGMFYDNTRSDNHAHSWTNFW